MFRVVSELRPDWVLGENVSGFVSMGLGDSIADLESEGYTVRAFLIPAVGVGAPHKRERCFIVAHSGYDVWVAHEESGGDNTPSDNSEERQEGRIKSPGSSSGCGGVENVAHTEIPRLEGTNTEGYSCTDGWVRQSGSGRWCPDWWRVEPGVGRVADGVSSRMDRLKALGNAVVPQQVYPILKAIADIERGCS
jgi:DNA (cytosine-5)-methyltransferase 1